MKKIRSFGLLLALALLGGVIGFLMSRKEVDRTNIEPEKQKPHSEEVAEVVPETFEWVMDAPLEEKIVYPDNAVRGELIVHFDSRADYLAYLQALADLGLAPLGQIDQLMAVRIPDQALYRLNPRDFGGRPNFSTRIERPLPPVDIAPEALAGLTGFGISSREIVGEPVGGDGEGVVVAVLDSGIEGHAQFDDIRILSLDLSGGGIDGAGAGHGTSVASIIAGREGIAPNSELLVVRVLDEEGLGNSFHLAEGIVQAVDSGAQIINMSLGVYYDSPVLRQAVSYADSRGVLMVAAAGNDGYDRMPYPAAYDQVLSVTAIDANERQAVFPNQSESIDFAAPGVAVLTANEDQGTTLFSGTSAAAPFVAGTLASLISGDNALEPRAAVDLMQRYLNDEGAPNADPVYGSGVVDWNRLRERSIPDLTDVALAGIYLQPDAQPGTTMPIEVTVQNRGTNWFSEAQLEVFVGDAEEPLTFTLGSLGPGQTTSRQIFTQIPSSESDEVLSLGARVIPEDLNADIRLENNAKVIHYKPAR